MNIRINLCIDILNYMYRFMCEYMYNYTYKLYEYI